MTVAHAELTGGVLFAALMPHAPILIPLVGGEERKASAATTAALQRAVTRLVARNPDAVLVVSPHAPRRLGAFGLWSGNRLRGNFERFRAPEAAVDLPNDLALGAELKLQMRRCGLQTWEIPSQCLDHGALVPLWHLADAGWSGPTAVLALNYPGEGGLAQLGQAMAAAANELGKKLAIIASGDMSHRLTPTAPAGYDPRACDFDRAFIDCLRRGVYHELEQFDPELQQLAGEDALDSTLAAVAAVNWDSCGHEVLSYEGPFGVGYGVAVLFDPKVPTTPAEAATAAKERAEIWAQTLPLVAQQAVKATLFETHENVPPAGNRGLAERRGVFVTLRYPGEELRGCAGTVSPACENIIDETRQAARAAAFCDWRFPSVTWEELPELQLEVSVLGPPERVTAEAELDPDHYGVVVSTSDGREGCLLPHLPQVHSAKQQLQLAKRKAHIEPNEAVRLDRFSAVKFKRTGSEPPTRFMLKPNLESDHPAQWWSMLPDGRLECQLCPRLCKLHEGQRGFCFVRQRVNNQLVLTTYGRSSGFCIDPMEKKPLNHFYPGTSVLSFGTAGCNLGCRFCQNWAISKARESDRLADAAEPVTIARAARRLGCKAVAFTYNDPVIFSEYALDIAQACHAMEVQTVAVTAGYINPKPRVEFYQHMDAANVDLKGFTEEFYHKLCFGQLAPVLETLQYLHRETKVWLEVTSLLIPGENDDERQLNWAADWFAEHLGPDVPWHFTAFHPDFKMMDKPRTPRATLAKAREIARSRGLRYVYTGNIRDPAGSCTQCPNCGRVLIARDVYEIGAWNLVSGCCRFCGSAIPGRFEDQPGSWRGQRLPVQLS